MSVIENPAAYLNETNQVSYDEPTPLTKPAETRSPAVKPRTSLDETPLTSDKEKSMSPRQLNCTTETSGRTVSTDKLCSVSDLPDISLSSQIGDEKDSDCDPIPSDKDKDLSTDKPQSGSKPESQHIADSGKEKNSILALATALESDDSEDEEYVPGVDPEEVNEEQEEEKEGAEIVSRQYSLRDGIKGTETEEVKEVSHDDAEKKRADDIWSAFKADVAVPIKRKAKELETTIKEKTYDFAGEAVTVREEIKSKRKSLASTLGLDKSRKRRRESAPILSRTEEEEVKSEGSATSDPSNLNSTTTTGAKRSRPVSKLNSLVSRLTKRPKMTVLNKTALDWNKFKKDNNIEEDVKNEAKAEGYLAKQDFLNRADQKQFELEREIRAQQARRRQMMNSKQF
ncbi:hypothetical protein ACHWQZ_G008110 [Mnemiopsis leidyi]